MSYYYSYYLGYEKDGKIYPFAPYDCFGHFKPVIECSRSFASELHNRFSVIPKEQYSDELTKQFEYKTWNGETEVEEVKICKLDDLPTGSYIKRGYFLIEDVKKYERDNNPEDLFYDYLTPTVYAAMAANEVQFGKPQPRKNDFDEEYTPHTASDYMYYAYIDYHCEEYEAYVLHRESTIYDYGCLPADANIVIIMTEG